jgi:alpha-L-rhamnosidase
MHHPRILLAIILMTASSAASAAPVLRATDLRTEYRTNPLGIAETKPRLSWVLKSDDEKVRGQRQTGYQIVVASTREKLKDNAGDLWDSGKVQSDETIQIEYAGKPLTSGQRAFWQVKTWNAGGEESPWSEPATWSVGLLEEKDWKAKWIGYDEPEAAPTTAGATTAKVDPLTLDKLSWVWTDEGDPTKKAPKGTRYFANTITIHSDVKITKAVFVLTADDNFELFVNGKKAGNASGHTQPHEVEVTKHLKPGENFFGIAATKHGREPGGADRPAGRVGGDEKAEPLTFAIDPSWKFSVEKPAKWDEGAADLVPLKPAKEIVPIGQGPWGTPASRR